MLARPYLCYACSTDFSLLPDKCNWCGESMFINLDHAGIAADMYPVSDDEKKMLREEYHRSNLPKSEKPVAQTPNMKDIDMFSGYIPTADHEDDADLFGGLESETFLALETVLFAGTYDFEVRAKDYGFTRNAPCLVVVKNYVTGEVISYSKCSFDKEASYNSHNGQICYKTKQVEASCNNNLIVKIYCDLPHMNLSPWEVEVFLWEPSASKKVAV